MALEKETIGHKQSHLTDEGRINIELYTQKKSFR